MKIDSARKCEGTRYDCDDVNDLRQCDGCFFVLYRWVTGIVIILSIVCSLAHFDFFLPHIHSRPPKQRS